ncbi:MAG: penicillin-insensitive murein endopeptidase [Planctomycetota bacterium]
MLSTRILGTTTAVVALCAPAYAAPQQVTQGPLNLRSGPGAQYRVIATLAQGDVVDELGRIGDWSQVRVGSDRGWVASTHLAASSATPSGAAQSTLPAQSTAPLPANGTSPLGGLLGQLGGAQTPAQTPPVQAPAPTTPSTSSSGSGLLGQILGSLGSIFGGTTNQNGGGSPLGSLLGGLLGGNNTTGTTNNTSTNPLGGLLGGLLGGNNTGTTTNNNPLGGLLGGLFGGNNNTGTATNNNPLGGLLGGLFGGNNTGTATNNNPLGGLLGGLFGGNNNTGTTTNNNPLGGLLGGLFGGSNTGTSTSSNPLGGLLGGLLGGNNTGASTGSNPLGGLLGGVLGGNGSTGGSVPAPASSTSSNPSSNAGLPNVGQASQAGYVQLPDSGPGFYGYYAAAKRWGKPDMVYGLMRAARSFNASAGVRIGVGDISLQNGGQISGHASHQKGVDADVRPLRTDKTEQPVTIFQGTYSSALTGQAIAACRAEMKVTLVLFNDGKISGVTNYPNHDNHFHVRIQ